MDSFNALAVSSEEINCGCTWATAFDSFPIVLINCGCTWATASDSFPIVLIMCVWYACPCYSHIFFLRCMYLYYNLITQTTPWFCSKLWLKHFSVILILIVLSFALAKNFIFFFAIKINVKLSFSFS